MRKNKRALAKLMAAAMAITMIPASLVAPVSAAETDSSNTLSYEGYTQVWADEFEGTSLNRNDWNVELHEPGWVNSELQEYVDSEENIYVKDGKLYLNPVKTVEVVGDTNQGNMISNADFSQGMEGWTETIANWDDSYVTDASSSTAGGAITYVINNAGTADWHIQLKKAGISFEAGETYVASYKITSTETRSIKSGVMTASYEWMGGLDPEIQANTETEVTFEFTTAASGDADFYISLGMVGETPASTVTISDISIKNKNYQADPNATTQKVTYTSGRVNTQNKHDYTYGLFEISAKVPAGMGYLPAFWLMATDENVYGQWPRCGEIDCMEVMGQDTTKAYGTIHYGNPHSESQGTYVTSADNSFSNEYHTYSCEWEPGKIRWYIDGVLYHEESDWYSTTEGQGTVSYPAPFDQPFYIILNLAVGGSWVGYPDESTSFDNNPYSIDYVRVYQKDSYDENVEKPVKEVIIRDPDTTGNYIVNGNFEAEDLTDDSAWKFLTALSGEATATIADNTMTIDTVNEGTVDYSVQLVQANLPLVKGATYEVSYDAYASEERTMRVDMKAPDRGYRTYMNTQVPTLTTEKKTYTNTFTMSGDTDANGRLEFNMGSAGSTASIYISNVSVKKIADPDPNAVEKKTVLADGNYVYNGSFNEGTAHMGEWDVTSGENDKVSVTSFSDGRRLLVIKSTDATPVTISQTDLAFTSGNAYQLSFKAQSDSNQTVTVNVGGKTFSTALTSSYETYTFKISAAEVFANSDISVSFEGAGTVYFDDIKLIEDSLIKNGSFNSGFSGYEFYADSSASASYGIDSLTAGNDNALVVTVNNTSDQDWKIQVKQNNVPLEQGKTYTLTYKAKSDMARTIRVVMQGQADKNWAVYGDSFAELTSEYQTFTKTFVMEAETDPNAFLSICLGNVDGVIETKHAVTIDDISLVEGEVATEPTDPAEPTDPVEPTDPAEPTDPVEPTDPTEPTDPVEPTEPTEPVEPEKPVQKNTIDKVIIEKDTYVYTGKKITPKVTVIDQEGNVVKSKYYKVKYTNNKKVGTATITVTGKKPYKGTAEVNFDIVPTKTTITLAKSYLSKTITLAWIANVTGTHYEVEYSTDKNFEENVKSLKVKKNLICTETLKGLDKKTTYYVRIRTCKTVGNKAYCGPWSSVKVVKSK